MKFNQTNKTTNINNKKQPASIPEPKNNPSYNNAAAEVDELRKLLKQSQEKYAATFDAALSAIASVDEHGKIIEYNKAAAELFGINRTEMLGKSMMKIMRPESYIQAVTKIGIVKKKGYAYGGEYKMITKDKKIIDVVVSSAAVRDENGRFLRTISVLEDVTERNYMETVLRESEEKYRVMFNSTNDAVFVFPVIKPGKPGKFIAVNRVACERLGYTREELMQMTPEDIHSPQDREIVRKSVRDVGKNKNVKVETFHRAKNGALLPVEITANVFELRGKHTIIVSARDISERKKSEEFQREQLSYKELRGQIWKLAAEKSFNEEKLIKGLLEALGASFKCQRTVYSAVKDGKFTGLYEWKGSSAKGSVLGFGVPEEFFRGIKFMSQSVLDKELFLSLVAEKYRKMAKNIAGLLIRLIGENSALVTQCVINGRQEGLVSCVCEGDSVRNWPDEKKQLVLEVANIISGAIERHRALELVKQQGRYKELRAQIWKMAADKNITEHGLISGLIEKIGIALGAERVAYSSVKDKSMTAEFEWRAAGVKGSSIGVKLPLDLFNAFEFFEQEVINRDNIMSFLPKVKKGVMTGVIAELLRRTASPDKEALSTNVVVGGRKFSAITCVLSRRGMWTEEKKTRT